MSKHVLNTRLPRRTLSGEMVDAPSLVPQRDSGPAEPGRRRAARRKQGGRVTLPNRSPPAPLDLPGRPDQPARLGDAGPDEVRRHVHDLYRRHSATLLRILTRRTGCRDLARELTQETFVKLLRMAPATLGGIERPEAYLRRISSNLLCDWTRLSPEPTRILSIDSSKSLPAHVYLDVEGSSGRK